MSQEDGERPPDRIAGRPLDDAVDAVVAEDDARDRSEVRGTLSHVTEDGVVTTDAVDEALSYLSNVVSTPETRAELAAIELSDAREAADPVADLDTVQARLDAFAARLDAVEARLPELGADLRALVADDAAHDDVYETAAEIRRLTVAANEVQGTADELQVDIEEFERWLGDPAVRFEAFAEELDALDGSLADLAEAVGSMTDAERGEQTVGGAEPAVAWADTALRHRSVGPLFPDLRAELADLRTWNDRDGIDAADRTAELERRLDDLHDRWQATGDRLHDVSRPAWRERFGDRLSAFEATLDALEPPIDWGTVQAELDEHRAAIDDST
jgi:division protein CdvB (Snf7/Vps24/ESCRT-III family)